MRTYNQNYVHIDIVIWYIYIYIWIIGFMSFMSFIIVKCLLCNGNTTSSSFIFFPCTRPSKKPWGEAPGKIWLDDLLVEPWNMEQMHIGLRYSILVFCIIPIIWYNIVKLVSKLFQIHIYIYIWQIFYIQLLGIICHIWISIPNNWIELVF